MFATKDTTHFSPFLLSCFGCFDDCGENQRLSTWVFVLRLQAQPSAEITSFPTSPCQLLINVYKYSGRNPTPEVWAECSDFQKAHYGKKGQKSNFLMEKSDKLCFKPNNQSHYQ